MLPRRTGLCCSRGVAVIQSVDDYEKTVEQRAFMEAVVKELANLEAGKKHPSLMPGRGSVCDRDV